VPSDVLRDYELFLNGRNPLELKDYSGPHARRDVAELVLVQQALAAGGMREEVEFLPTPSYGRLLAEVERGAALLTGNTVWLEDIREQGNAMLASSALIPEGRFEAGFYAPEHEARPLAARSSDQLRALRAVSCASWRPDWRALEALHPASLLRMNDWEAILRVLALGRADYTLAPFSNAPGLALETPELRLLPIPGFKIALSGSRHIAVSALLPRGRTVLQALDRGLEVLREQGVLEQAYRECGFYNPAVRNWTLLP
ncbi:MAG: hypothetical protein AB7E32_17040, partial [Desulfovibrio sp.]